MGCFVEGEKKQNYNTYSGIRNFDVGSNADKKTEKT